MTGVPERPGAATSGALRLIRGTVVGLSAVGLGLTCHLIAAGTRPGFLSLVVLALVAVMVSVALSGQRWRLPSLLAVLVVAQAVFHVCFGGMVTAGPANPGSAMSGMNGIASPAGGSHAWMVGAHVCAAVVTALVLRRGEDWCWSLLEMLAGPLLALRLRRVVAPGEERVRPLAQGSLVLSPRLLAWIQPRRGPPVTTWST